MLYHAELHSGAGRYTALGRGPQAPSVAAGKAEIEDLEQRDGDLEHAIELMTRHGTLLATLERARHYAEAARRSLTLFRDSPERRALDDVIDFCLARGY